MSICRIPVISVVVEELQSSRGNRDSREKQELVSQSISRVLSRAIIYLGCLLPDTSCSLPKPSAGRTIRFLFGLTPGGVYHAATVTSHAVRSYRTISPLPSPVAEAGRYIFCGTFRRLTPPRCYLAPYPMEPGLSSPSNEGAIA